MVEQIRISPEEVRGYGNVCEEHSLDDFTVSVSSLSKVSETVHGALTNTYKLLYSVYGLMFDFDKGAKQLYLQTNEADTLSLGFDTVNKQLYLVDENDTGFSLDFDEDTNELYITDDAPPIVHNYSLAFSSSSYVATGGSAEVSVTLLDDNVAVTGATISFTGGTSTVTGVTNSSGVATATVSVSATSTITATYQNVTDTCTITVPPSYIFYDECNSSSGLTNYGSLVSLESSGTNAGLTYDSTENAYALTSLSSGLKVFPITDLNGKDDFKLSFQFRTPSTTNDYGLGISAILPSSHTGVGMFINKGSGGREVTMHTDVNNSETGWTPVLTISGYDTTKYYKLELTVTNGTATFKLYKYDDTLLKTETKTLSDVSSGFNTVANRGYGLTVGWKNNSSVKMYIKNIKAEYI